MAAASGGTSPDRGAPSNASPAQSDNTAYWNGKAHRAQAATARWLTVVRGHPPHFSQTSASSAQAAYDLWRTWHRRAVAAAKHAKHPPELKAWYCIHSHEGSWTDPNAPYWGGLQMDHNFQSAYGPWLLKHQGTADHWTPFAQIWAGVRAWRVRGFEPWSTTAHACGVY